MYNFSKSRTALVVFITLLDYIMSKVTKHICVYAFLRVKILYR